MPPGRVQRLRDLLRGPTRTDHIHDGDPFGGVHGVGGHGDVGLKAERRQQPYAAIVAKRAIFEWSVQNI